MTTARVRTSTAGVALAVSLAAAPASAFDARVDAALDAQYYAIRSPFGEPSLSRRRYTSSLGLELMNLQGEWHPRRASYAFRSRLRVDSDFGIDAREFTARSQGYVPGLSPAPLEVLYTYLEGSGLAGGLLGFRLGRQYQVDSLGYWSFDGALVELRLPVALMLSGYAGFEQRTGLPMLASGRFSGDGVWRGNRDGLETGQFPAYLEESKLAPALGASLETQGFEYLHARFSYRRVQNRSRVLVSPFLPTNADPEFYQATRTSSERAAASLDLNIPNAAVLSSRAIYDLLLDRVTTATASLDGYIGSRLQLGALVDYFFPSFDGDSIFNWFTRRARTTTEARIGYAFTPELSLSVASGLRWFERGAASDAWLVESGGRSAAVLARANARYYTGLTTLTLDASAERAESAHSVGADVTGRRLFSGGRYDTLAIVSLYDFASDTRADRSATSFSYVLGAGVRPGPGFNSRSRLGFEWEHSMSRLVGQRFRVLLTLDLTVAP